MNKAEAVINKNGAENEAPKLKFFEKLSLVLPAGFGTFYHQIIQLFLLFFYTDVMELNPGFVAVLFLVTSIISAVVTPIFGIVFDRVTTPWGKYKPWFILFFLAESIMGFLTFTNFNAGSNGKYIYAAITYVLFSSFISIGQGPNGAINPTVTKRVDDRVSIGQISYFMCMIGATLAQVGVQPLYKAIGGGNVGKGFSLLMLIVALIAVLFSIMMAFKIKERYVTEKPKNVKEPSLKKMCGVLITNKYAIICYVYALAINLSMGIRTAVSIYYFKYYFHFESLLSIAAAISIVPVMIGVIFSSKVTKKIGVRKNLLVFAFVDVVTLSATILLPPSSIGMVLYIGLLCFAGIFNGLATPAQGTMMPAAMDYTEWKTGLNINSFMSSFNGILQALSTALAGSATAAILAFFGYVPGAAEQNSMTVMGIRILMSVIPGIVAALIFSVAAFDLSEEKQTKITKELAERRKKAENNMVE